MAKHSDKPLSASAQKAAATATLNESRLSLDEIAEQFPYLAEGVALLKKEAEKKPKPARVGATVPQRTAKRRIL
jgi:hypothetical protein